MEGYTTFSRITQTYSTIQPRTKSLFHLYLIDCIHIITKENKPIENWRSVCFYRESITVRVNGFTLIIRLPVENSVVCCSSLQTVWTQIITDRTSVIIWINSVWHTLLKEILKKLNLKTKSADNELPSMQRVDNIIPLAIRPEKRLKYMSQHIEILYLSYDVASGSKTTPCNKIDKPLVVYRFTGNVMTSITTLRK